MIKFMVKRSMLGTLEIREIIHLLTGNTILPYSVSL